MQLCCLLFKTSVHSGTASTSVIYSLYSDMFVYELGENVSQYLSIENIKSVVIAVFPLCKLYGAQDGVR
jgi:hypothetical protein